MQSPPDSVPLVVLVSGGGTILQALIEAAADPDFGAHIAAVGADVAGIEALSRADRAGIPTFVARVGDHPDRGAWDAAITAATATYEPGLVVTAGFMKILGPRFVSAFAGRIVNTHPALLPSFPGAHAVRDALAYGVTLSGCTCHLVDAGVDSGPIVAQRAVPVLPQDTEATLHERIKAVERPLLVECVGRMARDGFTLDERKVWIP